MHWFRRKRQEEELERELRMHLELEAAEQREASSANADEAQYAARRALGNLTRVTEDTRAVWTVPWFEDLVADLRFAARTFLRNPE